MNYIKIATFSISLCCITLLSAQDAANALPKVFELGKYEEAYELAKQDYAQNLLSACNNDMKAAFDNWLGMMKELEAYAGRINFDLKGVKMRLHVFWNTDGMIEHIGFVVRPDSRNARTEELSALFSSFMRQYKFPLTSTQKYAHYTLASFPTFSEPTKQ